MNDDHYLVFFSVELSVYYYFKRYEFMNENDYFIFSIHELMKTIRMIITIWFFNVELSVFLIEKMCF